MSILIKPIITEKATANSELRNCYTFSVNTKANKVEIKKAVKADTARQQKKEDLWAIGGNVTVTNGKGEQMETELLYWDKANERIYSESAVQIKTDGQLIMGKGFEADQEFNNYRIFKVQGQITIDDE